MLLGLAALAVVPYAALSRRIVRIELERFLDRLLVGEVHIDRVAHLSLAGVTAEGVTVRDGQGRVVLRGERLELGLDPRALLRLRLHFTHGLLEDATIRAVPSDEAALSLFEALSPVPSTPETPPDASDAGGLDVLFEHLHVVRARIYGSVPGLAQLEVTEVEARGAIRIVGGELAVLVTQARGDLRRPFPQAMALEHAIFALDTSPLRMALRARVTHAEDRARAVLTYRTPETGADHLDLRIGLEPVSPELLVNLGVAPAEILLTKLRGHVHLGGPLAQLALRAHIVTDAGTITLRGALPESEPLVLRIESEQLELAELIAYAPPLSLKQARVDVRAQPSGAVQLSLRAPMLGLYGISLREAEIAGTYSAGRLTVDEARVLYGAGHVAVSGWVDADADLSLRIRSRVPDVARDAIVRETGLRGSLRTDLRIDKQGALLTVDGSLGIEKPEYAGFHAKELILEGSASARDDLSKLRLNVRGASWGSTLYGYAIGDVEFRARGASPAYSADFDLIDGRARTALAHVELRKEHDGYRVLLSPLELGVPLKEPWRAKADLTFAHDGVTFHQVFLANGPQRLELSGRYSYTKAYRVDATLQSFDLGGLRVLSGLDLADLDGTIDGKLALTGVPGHPRIDAQGSLRSGVFLGMQDLTVLVSLVSLERRFDVDAELVLPDRSHIALYAGGEPGRGATWLAQLAGGNYQFGLDFERVPLEVGRPWLGWLGLEPPPGKVSATIRGAGTISSPYLDVKSRVEGLELEDWPALDLEVDAEHDGKRALLRGLSVGDEKGPIARLQGFIEARVEELLDPLGLRASLAQRPLELVLSWEDRRLDELPQPMRVNLAMPSWGSLRIAQTKAGPSFDLLTRLGWPEAIGGVDACGTSRKPHVELRISAHDLRTTGKLTARLDHEELAMADLEADTPIVAWLTGVEPLYLPRTSFTLNLSTPAAEEVPGLCELIAGPLQVDVSALDAFAEPPELRFEVRSSGLQLVASEHQRQRLGTMRDVRTAGRPFALTLRGQAAGPSFTFEGGIEQEGGARLDLAGSVPRAALRDTGQSADTWPLAELELSAHRLELAHLLIALPVSVRGSGLLDGRAHVTYELARDLVTLDGGLVLRQGKLVLGSLGQELSDVHGQLALAGDTLRIESLEARDFDGRIAIDGQLQFAALRDLRTELALALTDFPIRRESAQVSRLTGSMRLRATTTPERTRAELVFGELRVNLPNDLGQGLQSLGSHPDIFVRGEEVEQAEPDPYLLELRVLAQAPPFRVLRSDLSAEVAADMTVRYRAPSLTLQGSAEIKRGSFELYGKRFELGESRLAFDGSEELDPLVSLGAMHRTGGDEIGVRVEGRLSAPKLSFTHSNPAITEPGEIIAQLLGARSSDPASSNRDANGAAASILAGATAGLLTSEVRRELGGTLPVFSLESGSQSLRGARIRAGVQLDQLIERRLGPLRSVVRGAYVEGFVAPGATEQDVVNPTAAPQSRGGGLLELRFPKDLVGTIEYRPVQNWRLDLAWEP